MKIRGILESKECKPLFDQVQSFVSKSLSEYNNSLEKGEFCFSDKDIFDFVWGTVEFSAAEMCILDSPLLQRLRHIRQLGLASTVYCNADSSRFSHTIGVTEVASRMAKSIASKADDVLKSADFAEFRRCYDPEEVVRLAAIFHDTGHMFYSHVSELFFSYDSSFPKYDEITKAKSYFCEKTSANTSLHELFSVMIVNSDEVIRLIKNIAPYMKLSRPVIQAQYLQLAELISCLIIGVPVNKYILPFSQIINSAIDADKLDYLSRDSQCTKVPIAVDIARIIQKLDVVSINAISRTDIWDDVTSSSIPYKIMAIKNSAKKVFFQLSNARASMFESVYYHHKVLTAESMFRVALRTIFQHKEPANISFCDILEWTDDSFNKKWEYCLLNEAERSTISEKEMQEISQIFEEIRNRKLFKRVASFSNEILIASKAAKEDFMNVIIQDPLSADFNVFTNRLKEEYDVVCNLLGVQAEQQTSFMFIHSKYDPMDSVAIENGDGYCIWSSQKMKQDTIEAGKKSKQEQAFLITNCENRLPVYLALEKVIKEFDIEGIHPDAAICAKLTRSKLNSARSILLEADYYKEHLDIIQDDLLQEKVYDNVSIQTILSKYRSFSGINNNRIDKDTLFAFLRQFLRLNLSFLELKYLMNGILLILREGYYLDRDSFTTQFTRLLHELRENADYDNIYMICLGGLFDSAHHLYYYINDIPDKKNYIYQTSLKMALDTISKKDCLCFFDDGAYSGNQVISIFQEWMGVPVENRTTTEHHVDELPDEDKQKFVNCQIELCYVCFNSESEAYILEEIKKLGFKNISIRFCHDLSMKIFDANGLFKDNIEQCKIVEAALDEIGVSILTSTKKINGTYKNRWDEKRVKNSSLGYNNAQQLVVFNSNIPTYSLTPMWANGEYAGSLWIGLFQRTNKD